MSHRNCLANLAFVRKQGVAPFIAQQRTRIRLLEKLIAEYDDGRSKSSYCLTAALLPVSELKAALAVAGRRKAQTPAQTKKEAAAFLKADFQQRARKTGVDLAYRKA